MSGKTKIIYIDMDGVLADFDNSPYFNNGRSKPNRPSEMYEEGFFSTLPVIKGSQSAVYSLFKDPRYEVYILTHPLSDGFKCYSEKAEWIYRYFPYLHDRIILACDKGLLKGDYLIDDSPDLWKDKFEGAFIHFRGEWTPISEHFS